MASKCMYIDCACLRIAGGILACSRWLSAAIPSAMECQMNRTLKGCKRRVSPVYLLIRCAIFKICWHPFRVREVLDLVSGGIAALNHRLKAGIPSGCGRKKSKGSGLFLAFRHPFRFRLVKICNKSLQAQESNRR